MKKIGLIGAMNSEITAFCETFSAKPQAIDGYFVGRYGEYEIVICESGIGKVNAAIAAQRLIDRFDVDCIINSGVAGGVAPNIAKMDIVISERLTYHDFYPLEILDKYPPHGHYITADDALIEKAVGACVTCNEKLLALGKKPFTSHVGTIVSGDCFVDSSEKAASLHREHGALCTEMEGAAIAHVAKVNKVPFLVIRAISDFADEQADDSFESFEQIAADRAAFIVKEMLS